MRNLDDPQTRGRDAQEAKHEGPHPGKETRHGHVHGGTLNPDLADDNRHPDFNKNFAGSRDPNRIGKDKAGDKFKTTAASGMYQNSGEPVAGVNIPAGTAVSINAGAITRLVLKDSAGKPHGGVESCVYVFDYDNKTGWVPVKNLPPKVAAEQHTIATRIADQRENNDRDFAGKGIELRKEASAQRDGVADLYTYPHQTGHANMAKYYYGNLTLNLPDTGGDRVGVIDANIPSFEQPPGHAVDPYREFYPEEPHKERSIPLYRFKQKKPTGQQMHFVYGYVKTDAGAKLYGWLNKAMLGEHFDPTHKKGAGEKPKKPDSHEE